MNENLRRSRKYGVGKEIGGAIYVHRRYENVFGDVVATAREHLPEGFEYDVVKYDSRSGNVSFVESPDFDTSDEPIVGEIVTEKSELPCQAFQIRWKSTAVASMHGSLPTTTISYFSIVGNKMNTTWSISPVVYTQIRGTTVKLRDTLARDLRQHSWQ
jgi:hypothetical protein